MTPLSALSFGVDTTIDFSLTGEPIDSGATYWWEATSGGIDFGNPDAIVTEIQSQLLDGSLGKVTSWENRTVTLQLRLWSSTESVSDLEDGEAALLAEVNRAGWNQLGWTPAIAGSATTVYDVVYSVLTFTLDEASERNCIRNYTLTLTCLPRPRSATAVTVPSLPAQSSTPATTTVNDGSSVTGWSTTGRVESRRNLIVNPSFDYGAAGWTSGTGTSTMYTRSAPPSGGPSGSYLLFAGANPCYVNATAAPVTAGTTYYIGLSSGASWGAITGVLYGFYNSAGALIGSGTDHALSFGSTWGSQSFSVTAPTGASALIIYPHANAGGAMDSVYISTVNSYFDGDSANCAWVGTPGNSPSVLLSTATVATSGGMVSGGKTFGTSASLTLTKAIDASTQTYIAATGTVAFTEGGIPSGVAFTLTADGTAHSPASMQYDSSSGAYTAYFRVAAAVSAITLTATGSGLSGGFTTLKVDNVFTSDSLPVIGTPRQQARRIAVYGSARTQASLRISTTDAALGARTLVFCSPSSTSGFQPALRQRRTAGPTTTADSTMASGSKNSLATSQGSADTWNIATTALDADTYDFYALLIVASATTVTLNWRATGAANSQIPVVTGSRTVTIPAGGDFVSIASLDLPTARTYAGSVDNITLQLWVTSGTVTIDDAYLFRSIGQLAIIDTTSCSLLLLNSASIDEPEATVWVGKAINSTGGSSTADTSVVFAGNRAFAWEQMQFPPPTVNVFVVTPGTTLMQVSGTYYPRWGHHAGSVAA